MIRIDFYNPLTALEIRDPAIDVCKDLAEERELHVTFHQPQQPAFGGHAGQRRSQRQRIGNGKHKNWFIDYQLEEPQVSRSTVVGRIALRAPYWPEKMQFGGFDYGKFGEPSPTYSFVTVHTLSELGYYRPIDPEQDLLEATYEGLKAHFEARYPRLFEIADFSL